MTDIAETVSQPLAVAGRRRFFDLGGILLTLLTVVCAAIWFFPLYWAVVTSLKDDSETVRPGINLLPDSPNLEGYAFVIRNSNLPYWYMNSTIVSATRGVHTPGTPDTSAFSLRRSSLSTANWLAACSSDTFCAGSFHTTCTTTGMVTTSCSGGSSARSKV